MGAVALRPLPELPIRQPTTRSRLVKHKTSKVSTKRIIAINLDIIGQVERSLECLQYRHKSKPEICESTDQEESGLSTTRHGFRYKHNLKNAVGISGSSTTRSNGPIYNQCLRRACKLDGEVKV
ncbi:unnamed protein product [Hymenolepis diminuta]|uniref:Uncharacterized protein n=1 Tax=Hymenolepis diminuta TaxID=6216 RepID=A0A564XU45_HYMDI|nr:unnamed protein product [Hymenolepis diminuta]VUZ38542.1 unnamed protein product [Hymenolepis diminuta]